MANEPIRLCYNGAMSRSAVWMGASIGGFIGGWIPTLAGADWFSLWSLLGSTAGGLLGIWAVYRIYKG